MAASRKCKAVTAAPEIAALLKDKGRADEAKKVQKFLVGGPLDAFLQTGRLKTRKCQWPPVSPKTRKGEDHEFSNDESHARRVVHGVRRPEARGGATTS